VDQIQRAWRTRKEDVSRKPPKCISGGIGWEYGLKVSLLEVNRAIHIDTRKKKKKKAILSEEI